ncbi:hypothetical protein EGW08_023478 [Elysia chlorotica]|uniref:Calcium uniporter protein n=1 Tax=Elysia chlorotica TaxID=188477 RepID=A0A3S1AUN8_ELYCH|nr:hypothetical protein EGW08_023478 [Elysia chlorotica]
MAAVAPLRMLLSRSVFPCVRAPISSLIDLQIPGATCRKQFIFSKVQRQCFFRQSYCTQVLYQTDVTVEFRDGLPVVTLPLPSRKQNCEFTLKPISQSVGDFVRFIKEEDGGIDTVSITTTDGSRIAKSTSIDVLMRSEFNISINDQKYHVSPPVIYPLTNEDAQTLTDVKLLVSQLYSTLNVESYQLEREKELRKRLEDLNTEIAPLEKTRANLFVKANNNTNNLAWLGLGMMSLQFGILARLTWWEYSWDIMEPVTYFVTYGTSMAMFAYFVLTKQEYVFPDVKDRQFLIKFHKLASKEKLDVEKYNTLKDAIAEAENDLQRLRDPLQLHLPIKEMEKIAKKE